MIAKAVDKHGSNLAYIRILTPGRILGDDGGSGYRRNRGVEVPDVPAIIAIYQVMT